VEGFYGVSIWEKVGDGWGLEESDITGMRLARIPVLFLRDALCTSAARQLAPESRHGQFEPALRLSRCVRTRKTCPAPLFSHCQLEHTSNEYLG
jgi:hypothetical protein